MMFREKKELDALCSAVFLDVNNNLCRASYPEIDPDLEFKDNKWQAVAMSMSMEKHLKKAGMMEVYNGEFKDLLDRGCIEPVSTEEIEEWKGKGGKISYISHHPVITPDSHYALQNSYKLVLKEFREWSIT